MHKARNILFLTEIFEKKKKMCDVKVLFLWQFS